MWAAEPLALAATPTVDERPGEAEDGWYYATPYVPTPAAQEADELAVVTPIVVLPYALTAEQLAIADDRISSRWALWQYGFAGAAVIAPPIHRRLGSARGVAAPKGRR